MKGGVGGSEHGYGGSFLSSRRYLVVDEGDARMSGLPCDLRGIHASSDEQYDAGVFQVMWAKRSKAGLLQNLFAQGRRPPHRTTERPEGASSPD